MMLQLAEAGFDVWMGNNRGTEYSQKHDVLSPTESEFWNFTWETMGRYDIPAMIETVKKVTGHQKLFYVGYS